MNLETRLGASLVLGIAIATSGCSDEQDALSAAHNAGWERNTRVVDSSYFFNWTCEKKEIAYKIEGTNPGGKHGVATVCCGYTTPMKGCTIRY